MTINTLLRPFVTAGVVLALIGCEPASDKPTVDTYELDDASASLVERLGVEPERSAVIADCAALIDRRVSATSGLSGLAIKAAYSVVKSVGAGYISYVLDRLLDEWLAALQPYYNQWLASDEGSFADFLAARSGAVADDLLAVTDEQVETTEQATVRTAYRQIRGTAHKEVAKAAREIGRLIESHLKRKGAQ